MKISKNKLKQLIDEELVRDARQEQILAESEMFAAMSPVPPSTETSDAAFGGEVTELGNLMSADAGDLGAIQNNIQIMSRVLEKIPFKLIENEYLKDSLVDATQNLRDALDEIIAIGEEEEYLKNLEIKF